VWVGGGVCLCLAVHMHDSRPREGDVLGRVSVKNFINDPLPGSELKRN
jgi:hypothetical protein